MPLSTIPASKHPSPSGRQRNFSGAAVLFSADRDGYLVGIPRHDPWFTTGHSNMASGAKSLLQKQERDSDTDEESENDGLIVHDEELRPCRGKAGSRPRLEALYLSHTYKWFNHVALGGNALLLLWILWGVLTVRSYCPNPPSCEFNLVTLICSPKRFPPSWFTCGAPRLTGSMQPS